MARGSTLPAPRRGLRGAIAYRGGEGMLAWAFHRISGIAVSVFLTLHVVSIFMVGANPEFYDYIHLFYASVPGKVAEVHRAGTDHSHDQKAQRLEPRFAQRYMR